MQDCSIQMDCGLLDLETCRPAQNVEYDLLGNTTEEDVYSNLYSEDGCYNSTLWQKTQAFKTYEVFLTYTGDFTLLTGGLGIPANLLNIIVLARSEMANHFSQLLIAINICDSIQLLCAILETIRNHYSNMYPTQLLHAYPFLQYPALRISMTATIYLIIAVAIERYRAVCQPDNVRDTTQKNDDSSLKCIILCIFLAFLVNSFRFFETYAHENCYDVSHCGCGNVIKLTTLLPTKLRVNKDYFLYHGIIYLLCTGVVPFVVLVWLYTSIYSAVQKHGKKKNKPPQSHTGLTKQAERKRQRLIKEQKEERHLTIVLLTTIAAFLLCNLPRILTSAYEAIQMSKILECRQKYMDAVELGFLFPLAITQYLLVLNASSNLPIYLVTYKPFRKAIVQMHEKIKCWGKQIG